MTASLPRAVRTQRIPTRLGELHVRETGTGPVAVLWHGMFVDGTSWNRMLPALAMRRRLLIVDGPGHGRSDPLDRRSTIAECGVAAAELLASLEVDEPVDWLGNAWGGHVGIELAASAPRLVRSLVAVSSPTEPIGDELRRRITALVPALRLLGPIGPVRSAILDAQLTEKGRADRAVRVLVDDALDRARRAGLARAVRSFILDRGDATAQLPSISAPVLFVASDDRGEWSAADAAAAAALVRHGSHAVVPGARTLVPLEQPEALADHVLRFWSGVA